MIYLIDIYGVVFFVGIVLGFRYLVVNNINVVVGRESCSFKGLKG